MKLNKKELRKLIESVIYEDQNPALGKKEIDRIYDIESTTKDYSDSKGNEKFVKDMSSKRRGTRGEFKDLNVTGTIDGVDYSYEDVRNKAAEDQLPYIKGGTLDEFTGGDWEIQELTVSKGNMSGHWLMCIDKNTKNEKIEFKYGLTNNKTKKGKEVKDMLTLYKSLEKLGIKKDTIIKINKEIQSKNVPGEEELDAEIKKYDKQKDLNESLSRGSLYRRRYRRY